jgi:hypothetical protein
MKDRGLSGNLIEDSRKKTYIIKGEKESNIKCAENTSCGIWRVAWFENSCQEAALS